MKKFDIFLKRNIQPIDIIIQTLPFRYYLSASSQIAIASSLDGELIHHFLTGDIPIPFQTAVGDTILYLYDAAQTGLAFHSEAAPVIYLPSLPCPVDIGIITHPAGLMYGCYTGGHGELGLQTSSAEAEVFPSLCSQETNLGIQSIGTSDNRLLQFEKTADGFSIHADIEATILSWSKPTETKLGISSHGEALIVRFRKLSEMDDNYLDEYDVMDLKDVDYIIT